MYVAGKERYSKKVPPGYKDGSKDEPDCYGDPELRREMHERADVNFYMYQADQFMKQAGEHKLASVTKEAVEEARNVRADSEEDMEDLVARERRYLAESQHALKELAALRERKADVAAQRLRSFGRERLADKYGGGLPSPRPYDTDSPIQYTITYDTDDRINDIYEPTYAQFSLRYSEERVNATKVALLELLSHIFGSNKGLSSVELRSSYILERLAPSFGWEETEAALHIMRSQGACHWRGKLTPATLIEFVSTSALMEPE